VTGLPPRSGRKRSASPWRWHRGFKPASFGSTAPISSTRLRVSGAIGRADSAARAGARACSNICFGPGRRQRPTRPRVAKRQARSEMNAHGRAQVVFYIAENLSARAEEFEARLARATGASSRQAREEIALAIRRTFYYAAYADKFEGVVHATQSRNVTLAINE